MEATAENIDPEYKRHKPNPPDESQPSAALYLGPLANRSSPAQVRETVGDNLRNFILEDPERFKLNPSTSKSRVQGSFTLKTASGEALVLSPDECINMIHAMAGLVERSNAGILVLNIITGKQEFLKLQPRTLYQAAISLSEQPLVLVSGLRSLRYCEQRKVAKKLNIPWILAIIRGNLVAPDGSCVGSFNSSPLELDPLLREYYSLLKSPPAPLESVIIFPAFLTEEEKSKLPIQLDTSLKMLVASRASGVLVNLSHYQEQYITHE